MKNSSVLTKSLFTSVVVGSLLIYAGSCCGQESHVDGPAIHSQAMDIDPGSLALAVPMSFAPASPLMVAPEPARALDFNPAEEELAIHPEKNAIAAAVADGVTTGLALSAGAVEMNPIIAPTPLGLVAMTGMKIGLVKYAETLPQDEKRLAIKSSSAAWGGAAVNNLMVLMAAPPPVPLIAGLIMGFITWKHMGDQYEKDDQLIASRKQNQTPSTAEQAVPAVSQASITPDD